MVEAWAITWPPTGLRPSAPAKDIAPGSDWTWLVCGVEVSCDLVVEAAEAAEAAEAHLP